MGSVEQFKQETKELRKNNLNTWLTYCKENNVDEKTMSIGKLLVNETAKMVEETAIQILEGS